MLIPIHCGYLLWVREGNVGNTEMRIFCPSWSLVSNSFVLRLQKNAPHPSSQVDKECHLFSHAICCWTHSNRKGHRGVVWACFAPSRQELTGRRSCLAGQPSVCMCKLSLREFDYVGSVYWVKLSSVRISEALGCACCFCRTDSKSLWTSDFFFM
jgi:hypothetical protein